MISFTEHTSLRHLNTFGIDVKARYFCEVTNLGEVSELLGSTLFGQNKRLMLGGGSNLLLTRDFDGVVVKVGFKGIRVVSESEDFVTLKVGSGEDWHALVLYCVERNWGGIENLSLIPGTVGAAPMQNIGAYGREISEVLESVEGIELDTSRERRLTRDECQFGYRDSIFKHELKNIFLISSITLRLTKSNHRIDTHYGAIRDVLQAQKADHPGIHEVSDAVIHIRRSKLPDPKEIGNAGSFFKNPTVPVATAEKLRASFPEIPSYPVDDQLVKIPAGWLIEQCGWKGKKIGRTGVHERQALVLVNHGGASGEEILALARQIQQSVTEKFGVKLETEVNIV